MAAVAVRRHNCSVVRLVQDIAIVRPQLVMAPGTDYGKGGQQLEPRHCVLLRASGVMTVLDLDQGVHLCMCTHS
jgi:hypothetical protein